MNRTLLAALAFSGAGLLFGGCEGDEAHFPTGDRTDDDVSDDDTVIPDDDTAPGNAPPIINIIGISPQGGDFLISYTVDDPDGDPVDVFFEFTLAPGDYSSSQAPTIDPAELADRPGGDAVATWAFASDIAQTSGVIELRGRGHDGETYGDWGYFPQDGQGYPFEPGMGSGTGALPDPGSLEPIHFDSGGDAIVPLSDGTIGSNIGMQFLLVLVNQGGSEALVSVEEISGTAARVEASGEPRPAGEVHRRARRPAPAVLPAPGVRSAPAAPASCVDELDEGDVDERTRDFAIRSGLDETTRETHPGVLRALADGIAIYVDLFTPIDIDDDCSTPEIPASGIDFRGAQGFSNCGLRGVADVVATNLLPNLQERFGSPSDVDGNCRVTVFLSNTLNTYTATDSSEVNDNTLVRSFSDPSVDLWESDQEDNPLSNEQEIVYVFAPDPGGFWNREAPVELDSYLNYDLAGQIASATYKLIGYATHVGIYDQLATFDVPPVGEALPGWLDDGLGWLAADLTGFGATVYPDAWKYLDATYLASLIAASEGLDVQDRGGAYLFARYFYDLYGQAFLDAVNTADPPSDVLDAIGSLATGGSGSCDAAETAAGCAVLQWAVATAVSGRLAEDGSQLVAESSIPNFRSPGVVVVSPPDVAPYPAMPGSFYGANGYQTGFRVRGVNYSYAGGTSPDGPTEIVGRRVLSENADPLKFIPTADFTALIAADYGIAVVEVSNLVSEETTLKIGSDGDLLGYVVRVPDEVDPSMPVIDQELVEGSLITAAQPLSDLPGDGSEICILGRVQASQPIASGDDGSEEEPDGDDDDDDSAIDPEASAEVVDTDRYLIRLSDPGTYRLAVHLDTRLGGTTGSEVLADPWLGIALVEDVPDHQAQTWPCSSPWEQYPATTLSYVHGQVDLISDPLEAEPGFDAAGPSSGAPGSLPCSQDFDQDGVQDLDEPAPLNFAEQIRVQQTTRMSIDPSVYAGMPSGYYPYGTAYIDTDSNELPENEFVSFSARYNVGGRGSGAEEQALLMLTLPGGDREYVVVVGDAAASTGPYDLCLRRLIDP